VVEERVLNSFTVLDVDAKDRHLLLMRKETVLNRRNEPMDFNKFKFLLGHDERDWFVAGVPDGSTASTVQAAKDILRPDVATRSIKKRGKLKNRNKRRNKGFVRQGEWFFVPASRDFEDALVLKNEPIVRAGGGKPHIVSEVVRIGGRIVHVRWDHPDGLSEEEFKKIPKEDRRGFRRMVADAKVYGRGVVRHPDHKTIKLPGWHEVVPNTENNASQMGSMTFLD